LIRSYNGGALADSLKIAGLVNAGTLKGVNLKDFKKWMRINPESKIKVTDSIVETSNRKASE